MTNAILKISASTGTFINFTYNYPIYLKNRWNSNKVIQLKSITINIFLLFIFYSYLTITSKNVFFQIIFLIDSICFLFLDIAFLGLLLYKIKPNSVFNLKNFITDDVRFYSVKSNFLKDQKNNTSSFSKINTKSKKTIINSSRNIESFISLVKKTSLYNPSIKNFKIDSFTDEINNRDSNLTELRAIQFIVIIYITEFLKENINSQNYKELMEKFNPYFDIKNNGKKQQLTSANWYNFLNDFKKSYTKSGFYNKILSELKKNHNF